MTTKRLTRQEIQEPDRFMTGMTTALAYVRAHPGRLALVSGISLSLLLAGVLLAGYWRAQRRTASEALGALLKTEARPVAAVNDEAAGSKLPPFPELAAKDNAIIEEADALLAEHRSGEPSRAAKLLKGRALAHRGRHQDALALFQDVAGSAPRDALGASAALARASSQASIGEVDAALQELTRLAALGIPVLPKDLVLMTAARIAAQAERPQQAREFYQRVVSETAGSPFAAEANAKLKELGDAPAPVTPAVATP